VALVGGVAVAICEAVAVIVGPSSVVTVASVVAGSVTATFTIALVVREHRIGRPIGLWDVAPGLAPGRMIRKVTWWDRQRAGAMIEGENRELT
jgi:hypothetical protein